MMISSNATRNLSEKLRRANPALLRHSLNQRISKRKTVLEAIDREKAALETARARVETAETAQKHLQELAQTVQQEAHKQVSKIVSKCLKAVFGPSYAFRIDFVQRRGKTEAEFLYLKDGQKVSPHVCSGGIKSVVSLANRLTRLVMTLPPVRRFLALDEPFAGLSGPNLQKMAALIQSLNKDLNTQFIIATHNSELRIGKVIEL